MRIGFLDSGIGGLTVLKEALKLLPNEDFLYYADTENVPYGTKNKEEVEYFICKAVDFMVHEGIKALVVACNTATSIAINTLRNKYKFPIVGMEPAVKPAIEKTTHKRVLVAATPLTLKLEKYNNLVTKFDNNNIVDPLPLPELVEYAEKFIFDEDIILQYLRNRLKCYDIDEYGTIVLGCTHFPFYKNIFKKLFVGEVNIVDGNTGTIKYLKKILKDNMILNKSGSGDVIFYSSNKREYNDLKYIRYLNLLN